MALLDTNRMYEAAGKLKWIGTTQSFPSGFTKREFVVTTEHDKYPQDLKFEVVKDKCSALDPFELGQKVQVSFDIRGNEYNGKYFVNLACWKIQATGNSPQTLSQSKSNNEPDSADFRKEDDFDDDDVPF